MNAHLEFRKRLGQAQRIVVKVGSRVLVDRSGRPSRKRLEQLVRQLAALRRQGHEVILVTSGAVGAGLEALSQKQRPTNLPDLQAAAAIGQVRLMSMYNELFQHHRLKVAQVLLTHADLNDRRRHLNARNTMLNLLRKGIIPIVNENDVISVDEIKLGDNDILASLVTILTQADLLVLLTVINGLREPAANGRTRRVAFLDRITRDIKALATGSDSHLSVGGMHTKLKAAADAVQNGCMAVIANGRTANILTDILAGKDTGTLLVPDAKTETALSGRKRWIAFFHRASGTVTVDRGAANALAAGGKSLLPAGIRKVEGNFETGALVNIQDPDGRLIARGLTEYGSKQIDKIKGKKTTDIASILGSKDYDEVVHRDNMVLLEEG